ncbi:MAG: hypothetical protein ACAH80_18005 [Alphaproteobacteria bacterium]
MENSSFLSIIAFGFIAIFSCAVYTLSHGPTPALAASKVELPKRSSIELSYVDGPQAEPPAWPTSMLP